MKKIFTGLMLASILLLGGGTICYAQTIYLNSATGSDATGNGTFSSPYKTFTKGYAMSNPGDILDLTGTFTWTDADETGDGATSGFTIAKNITIQGHAGQTVIQAASSAGSANCRVFTVDGTFTVAFTNLEIRYGNPIHPGDGGAMYFGSSSTITISNCYIHHNTSRQGVGICIMVATVGITNSTIANNNGTTLQASVNGGGICLQGYLPLTITNTTICNNYINGYGGGINTLASNTTIITNCMIVNNTSELEGGGISMGGPAGCAVQIKNTMVANNTSTSAPAAADFDMYQGTITDNGYNIVEVGTGTFTATGDITGNQANLFGTGIGTTPSLAINGSTNGTQTLALGTGSVAINAGNSTANGSIAIPTTDQRGLGRVGVTDIGAYEYGAAAANTAPTATAPSAPTVLEDATNVALNDNIQVADVDGNAQTVTFTVTGGTVSLGTTGITFGGGGNGSSGFTASGTLAAINTALDAATFTPTANLFGVNAGTISFTTNDGTVSSSAASVTFDIAAVNDAPTLSATSMNPTFTEDASAAVLFSSASASTFESGQTIIGLTLTVTNVNDGTSEILNADGTSIVLTNGTNGTTASNSLAYSVSVIGTTATVTFSGGGMTTAAVGTLINGMSYQNNSNNPNTSNRVITITSIQDNGGTANSGVDVKVLFIASSVTIVAIPPPSITSIAPTHGPAIGGTSVIITGINFTGATNVSFGSSSASFTVNSDVQITATSPIGTGVVSVTVTTSEGTSLGSSFTYDAPSIVALTPNSGTTAGGTSVTISGLNFTGATDVSFGATPASSFTVNSDASITATSPAGSGTVNVSVTSPSGTSNSMAFTYIPTVSFMATASSGLESVSSANLQVDLSAASASIVTVDYAVTGTASGSGVDYTLANGTLTIAAGNTTANITIASIVDDVLIESNETVIVTLSNPANALMGTNTFHTYTITDNDVAPIISAITPTHGPAVGGTTVTISGANFTGATDVLFGGVAAASFTVNSDIEISAVSPSGTSMISLTVITPVGTSNAATFTYDAPAIVSISPTFGPTAGGTSVTISGSNFTGTTSVSFGSNAATGFTVNSDASITATSPAGTGSVNVSVTSPSGTSNSMSFTYIPTVSFTATASSGLESVSSANLQVDLSEAIATDVNIDYVVTGTASGSGVDYTLANGTLTIAAGNTTANITIASIVDDALVEGDETVIVTLSNPANATLGTNTVHTYTITDNDVAALPTIAFAATASSGLESVSSADLQVELSEVSATDVTVDFVVTGTASGSGVDFTLADGTLTITAGNLAANITIASIVDDALVEGDETVIVTLSNPANATLGTNTVHTYTIIDNDVAALPTIAFTTTASSGLESVSSADLQVELSEISATDVTVDYVVTGTASGSGVDFTLADGTLTITAGNLAANITIASIVDDALVEGDETVIVTLSNPANATLGTNTVHTYTIIDNDSTVGVSEISINDLSVYPNPCSDYLYLQNVSSDISTIVISNLLGETVLKTEYKGENGIDVSRLPSGLYLLIVEKHNGEKQMIKIVKD